MTAADWWQCGGFLLMLAGLACYSVPMALVVGGAVIFCGAGMMTRRQR